MKRTIVAAFVAALTVAGSGQAHIAPAQGSPQHRLQVRIAHDRGVVAAVDQQARSAGSAMFIDWHTWLTRQWHVRDLAAAVAELARMQLAAERPAHYAAWLCIHRGEGSWTDSGDPYWGGLQMDRGFMETYGADMIARYHGYANVWPPLAQMIVAERAYASGRGFYPWPNTARACGLI